MRFEASFREVKRYTEQLLTIQEFKSCEEKLNYQRRLNRLKDHLIALSNEVKIFGYNSEIYFIEDLKSTVEKMEVFHLIKQVNCRLTHLSQ